MADQGLDITLRQLYYQLVARGVSENSLRAYKRLVDLITNARYAGLIDWEAVVDRTRYVRELPNWTKPEDILRSAAGQFRLDKWSAEYGQSARPFVLVEKDALLGVFLQICQPLDVPVLSCRGYTSASAMWRLAMRLASIVRDGQAPVMLHFGDHDPSGMDMSRDIVERLNEFMYAEVDEEFEFKRLALNMDQVRKYKPPESYAKVTDSRWKAYIVEFGQFAWELDALDPRTLRQLVQKAVSKHRDEEAWEKAVELEEAHRAELLKVADRLPVITAVLNKRTPKRGQFELAWKRVKAKKKKPARRKKAAKKRASVKRASVARRKAK